MIERVKSIAEAAGAIVMDIHRSGDFEVRLKEDRSPVTRADLASDEYIRNAIKNQCGIPCVTEETEVEYPLRQGWDELFLVDPLDGTKDFIRRGNEFTVNIALVRGGVPVLGVVYLPALGELFWAVEGKGAFTLVNGTRERLPRTSCAGIIMARSWFHDSAATEQFARLNGIDQSLNMSSAIRFCRLAEGKANLYPGFNRSMEWDTAAGHLILKEAGGYVVDLKTRREPVYNKPDLENHPFIACCGEIDFDRLVLPDAGE